MKFDSEEQFALTTAREREKSQVGASWVGLDLATMGLGFGGVVVLGEDYEGKQKGDDEAAINSDNDLRIHHSEICQAQKLSKLEQHASYSNHDNKRAYITQNNKNVTKIMA